MVRIVSSNYNTHIFPAPSPYLQTLIRKHKFSQQHMDNNREEMPPTTRGMKYNNVRLRNDKEIIADDVSPDNRRIEINFFSKNDL